MGTNKFSQVLISFAVITLAAFVLFYKLGSAGIYIWDEAIYANNALEIAMHGDWFVMKVDGVSNLYNTKPPLMIWLQAVSIKIFGASPWAVRLPAALSGMAVVICLLVFSKRSLGDLRIGWLSVLILISSSGYIRYHVTRSGDLDSLLTLFVVGLSLLFFHLLLHPQDKRYPWYIAMGLCGLLAYMTKSTAALIPIPGLILGSFYKARIIKVLKTPSLYLSVIVSIIIIVGYYAYRECLGSGYLDKVWHSEFLRFTDNIMPWHTKPAGFYFKKLFAENYFWPFAFCLPFLLLLLFRPGRIKKNIKYDERHFAFLLSAFIICFLAMVSYPATKIGWYLAPLYPFMSLGVAIVLLRILDFLADLKPTNYNLVYNLGSAVIAIFILSIPNRAVIDQITDVAPRAPQEYTAKGLSLLQEKHPDIKSFDLVMITDKKRHLDQAGFYTGSLSHYEGYDLRLISDEAQIDTLRNFFICHERDKKYLSRQHTQELNLGPCSLYLISR